MSKNRRRTLLGCAAFAIAAASALPASASELPDFGSPADVALSKNREVQLGRQAMLQLRSAGVVIDDPQLTEYIGTIGSELASRVNNGDYHFNFFLVKDDDINAFALPGGFIGVNTGLLLASENENELAAVLAHEISHVTQRHIARSMLDDQHSSIASMAAMLAAMVLGAASHMSGNAMEGVVAASQSMAAQRQLNFSRANEAEADRVGMDVLASAGFDPNAMGTFFEKLSQRYGSTLEQLPVLLQTHPLTTDRIAEARARARQLPQVKHEDSAGYGLAKARLRALNAPTPEAALALFAGKADSGDPADRYGLALSQMRMSLNDNAAQQFEDLIAAHPTVIAYRIGQAEALMGSGATDQAMKVYSESERLSPRNVPLTISYAEALIKAGRAAEAHALLLDLLNNVEATPEQLRLIARAANAEGDVGNAYFYMSYYYASIGDLQLAINQVRLALETPGVHTVDRSRFEARLKQLIEYLPARERRERPGSDPN